MSHATSPGNAGVPPATWRTVAPVLAAALLFSGCEREEGAEAPAKAERKPTVQAEAKVVPAGEPDLIGDKPPVAVRIAASDVTGDKPAAVITLVKIETVEELAKNPPYDSRASKCFDLIVGTRGAMEKLSADLDGGGKEVTRLIRTSDEVSKNITTMARLWPDSPAFMDACGSANRAAMVLTEELSRVPRKWTHVRWSFDSLVKELSSLRPKALEMAEVQPKPIPVKNKEGQIELVDADKVFDPETTVRNAKLKSGREELARARRASNNKTAKDKDKDFPIDLDGNK